MYRKITLIITLLIATIDIFGQKPSFKQIDSITYQAYLQKDWKTVITSGKEALKADIDYFYLRMRIGIAFYEKHNYQKAIPHFEAALNFNSSDRYALEYLYYSYLFSGRKYEAESLYKRRFNLLYPILKTDTSKTIESVFANFTYSTNNQSFNNENIVKDIIAEDYGDQRIAKEFKLYSAGLTFNFSNHFKVNASYSQLDKTNDYFYFYSNSFTETYNQNITQKQFYISPIIPIKKGITFWAAYSMLSLKMPYIYYYESTTGQGQGQQSSNILIGEDTYSENDQIFAGGISKQFPFFKINASLYYSTLNRATQTRPSLIATYYPLGNLNLYFTSEISYIKDTNSENKPIFNNSLGAKLFDKLWVEGMYTIGDLINYAEAGGFIVYNDINVLTERSNLCLQIPFANYKGNIVINYQYASYNSDFHSYTNSGIKNTIKYNVQSITGGISWNF